MCTSSSLSRLCSKRPRRNRAQISWFPTYLNYFAPEGHFSQTYHASIMLTVIDLPQHDERNCSVWPANHRAVVRQNEISHYRRLRAREHLSGYRRTRPELCDHRRITRSACAARCLYTFRRSQNPCCRPLPPCVRRTCRPHANPPLWWWCVCHPTQHSTACCFWVWFLFVF